MGTGLILLDLPATVMKSKEFNEWANNHALKTNEGLLKDLLIVASLSEPGYTIWEGSIYEW
jgi:hypothetical protein